MNETSLVVIGGGPGGYAAAFLAADLGLQVTLVDLEVNPGGVCLYRGCIPSKALLHVARLLNESHEAKAWGIEFAPPKIDLDKLRRWKSDVVQKLTGGLGVLTQQHKINFIKGRARFLDATSIEITGDDGAKQQLKFQHAILATGSRPAVVPGLSIDSPHLLNSTTALDLPEIPEKFLVLGGGYIGLELGSVYHALGSQVSVVEMTNGLLPGADRDLVSVLHKRLEKQFHQIMLNTKVVSIQEDSGGLRVKFEGEGVKEPEQVFNKVLMSVGRVPNSKDLGLENTRIELDKRGFVPVDAQRRTIEPTIYAIGDIAGEPMLAHKASHEGRIAVEVIAGHKVAFEPNAIPAVVFTDPEIAWCGLTETQAKAQEIPYKLAKFPWIASGRAMTLDRPEGLTKILVDPATERLLGVGIAGVGAGEMIAEGVVAIEMAALASDLKACIHPHPTLSETVMESAEVFFGQSTHYMTKKS